MDEWKLVDNMTQIALENIWKQKIKECMESNVYYNHFIKSPEPNQLPYPYSLIK